MTTPEEERDIPRFCPYCGSDPADCKMVSVCCGAPWSVECGERCDYCHDGTGFVCGSKEATEEERNGTQSDRGDDRGCADGVEGASDSAVRPGRSVGMVDDASELAQGAGVLFKTLAKVFPLEPSEAEVELVRIADNIRRERARN